MERPGIVCDLYVALYDMATLKFSQLLFVVDAMNYVDKLLQPYSDITKCTKIAKGCSYSLMQKFFFSST